MCGWPGHQPQSREMAQGPPSSSYSANCLQSSKPPLATTQTDQTTVPPQASWPPSHFSSAQPAPARSIRCTRPAQPGGPGTPSSPRSESRHREYPFSAGHWGPGGCWCSGLWTHTHTWGSQASHPQTCRSHPGRKEGRVSTVIQVGERRWEGERRHGSCATSEAERGRTAHQHLHAS